MPAPSQVYVPRDPRSGPLYPLVKRWWPELREAWAASEAEVPKFVERTFESYLRCGIWEEGFVRLRCPDCGAERALAMSCKARGLCPSCGARRKQDVAHHLVQRVLPDVALRQYVLSPPSELVGLLAARGETLSTLGRVFVRCVFAAIAERVAPGDRCRAQCGAIIFVQRFTKALTIFPHLHVLVLDGAYVEGPGGALQFREDRGPSPPELATLEDEVYRRFTRWLERHGYLDPPPAELDGWFQSAAREPSGLPRLTPARRDSERFQIHASVRVPAGDRRGRERLCLYAARPPLAEEQIETLEEDRVRLTLRRPGRSPSQSIVLHPLQLLRRLAWQIPPPRQHQIRYAGVLAPAAERRSEVVPVGRVAVQGVWFQDRRFEPAEPVTYRTPWAKLLARVYHVDGQACPRCPGTLRPVAFVLPPQAREWIEHRRIAPLDPTGPPSPQLQLPLTG